VVLIFIFQLTFFLLLLLLLLSTYQLTFLCSMSRSPASTNDVGYQKITPHDMELQIREDGVGTEDKQHTFSSLSSSTDLDYNGEHLVSDVHFKQKYSIQSYFNRLPLFGACVNFVNSIVGAGTTSCSSPSHHFSTPSGIIGMPVAIRETGFFSGVFLLIAIGLLIDQSVIMLVQCGIKNNKNNLEELCFHLFGRRGYDAASFFMFLYAYGAMVAYMVIIGDTVPITLSYFFPSQEIDRNLVILLSALFIILPLCLLRDMSSLAWTSFLSIVADFIMIIFVILSGPSSAREQHTEFQPAQDLNVIHYQLFLGIGTFSFAFVCQHNTFLVYQTLPTPNLENWSIVSHISLTIAVTFCLVLGLAGYLSFGQFTEGDILNNFTDQGERKLLTLSQSSRSPPLPSAADKLILVGRLLLASTMVFTFPMECYVARHILFSYYDFFNQRGGQRDELNRVVHPAATVAAPPSQPSLLARFARSATPTLLKSFSLSSKKDPNLLQEQRREEETERRQEMDELKEDERSAVQSNFPIHAQAAHHPEDTLLIRESSSASSSDPMASVSSPPKPLFVHVSITLLLWGSTVLIALVFSELSIVLALTGAVAASALGYIIPSLVYLQTYRHEVNKVLLSWQPASEYFQPSLWRRVQGMRRFFLPAFLFVFGVMTLFIGVGTVIYETSSAAS
jgi:solute carrier family 38 (sodium-coupled neutral amino acid transporter), member 11